MPPAGELVRVLYCDGADGALSIDDCFSTDGDYWEKNLSPFEDISIKTPDYWSPYGEDEWVIDSRKGEMKWISMMSN